MLDNSSTNKGRPVEQLPGQRRRLRIEHFPSYAPQLNPDEGVWPLAKRELANSCLNDADELMEHILGSIEGNWLLQAHRPRRSSETTGPCRRAAPGHGDFTSATPSLLNP